MTAGLVRDPAALTARASELTAQLVQSPRSVRERAAAAEAYVRLASTAEGANAIEHLSRARDLDPYRADIYLLLGVQLQRDGARQAALQHYDHAVLLAPADVRIRSHRAYALLDAARIAHDPDLAAAAGDDFERILGTAPEHPGALIGAVEALLYGKAKQRRNGLAAALARVPPSEALRDAMTRLLYQSVFSFGVGRKKSVDKKNRASMTEIARVAGRWLQAFPGDPALVGVVAATSAKCETAEGICANIASYARDIPDVRIVRLLLRERLADVSDPTRRLELFEGAMEQIPDLDGIAQDYLQLIHLVAKRAAAVGDAHTAAAGWRRCLDRDPNNPGAIDNLLRLAELEGDDDAARELRQRRNELWRIYARFSPRADLVFQRAAAELWAEFDRRVEAVVETPDALVTAADVYALALRLLRASALGRIGADPEAMASTTADTREQLLDLERSDADAYTSAFAVLTTLVPPNLPVAYAYLECAKDAPEDVLAEARDGRRADLLDEASDDASPRGVACGEFLARFDHVTAVLFDPQTREEYDRTTCDARLAELYRGHFDRLHSLGKLLLAVSDPDLDHVHATVSVMYQQLELIRPFLDAMPPTFTLSGLVGDPLGALWRLACTRIAYRLSNLDRDPQALGVAWRGYPGQQGTMPSTAPPGSAWKGVAPAGGFQYALCVARILRWTTIGWFNQRASMVSSAHAFHAAQRAALQVARTTDRWARYARAMLAEEPIPLAVRFEANATIEELLEQLEHDRQQLTEVS